MHAPGELSDFMCHSICAADSCIYVYYSESDVYTSLLPDKYRKSM